MNLEVCFRIVNTIVLPMWFLLIVLPNHKVTHFFIRWPLIPIGLAITYAIVVIPGLAEADMQSFSTLEGLMGLFQTEKAVLGGWMHYLVFDLVVGMYLVVQNRALGLSKWIMAPILLFTLMMGPIGFLLFYLAKWVKIKSSQP